MPKPLIDARRIAAGLPPIFCASPRPLTDEERHARGDIVIRDADGIVRKHFVPMCQDGWLIWVDVFNAR